MNQVLSRSLIRSSRSLAAISFRNGGIKSTLPGVNLSGVYVSRRYNSSEIDKTVAGTGDVVANAPVDLSALADASTIDAASYMVSALDSSSHIFTTKWTMLGLEQLHHFSGLPYWGTICLATIAVRVLLLPIALKTTQSSARMGLVRPEMARLNERLKNDPNSGDSRVKIQHSNQIKALFTKYDVSPFSAMVWPVAQLPIFLTFFVALREMGVYFPDFSTGGTLWFTNLAAADATMILPIFNSLTFLLMIELGSDGVQKATGKFKWIMRGMAVVMVPLTMSMPQGLFVYWSVNNVISVLQTVTFKNNSIRQLFNIPLPPPDEDVKAAAPVLKMVSPIKTLSEAFQKERTVRSNAKAEIIDGVAPAAPSPVSTATVVPTTSFAMPPKQNRRPAKIKTTAK